MRSKRSGKGTSEVEVTQISIGGIWLLIEENEFFLPFEKFPRFRKATVGEIHNVQIVNGNRLRWPDLDTELPLGQLGTPQHVPVS